MFGGMGRGLSVSVDRAVFASIQLSNGPRSQAFIENGTESGRNDQQ